jgi:predicted membrane protein
VGNLLYIFAFIAADEYMVRRYWRAEALHARLKRKKNIRYRKISFHYETWSMKHYVSFRTFLFIFYVLVLIAAQVSKFYPALIEESIASFLGVVEYSVIILLAFKDIGEEFPRDRSRARKRLEEFEHYLTEHPIDVEPP